MYEGRLKFYDDVGKETKDYEKAKSLSFCYFTWGYNPFTHIDMYKRKDNTHFAMYKKISVDSFKSTYYGYIKCI